MVRFCPIASGSSGNCIYVGSAQTHLLIDAGLSGKRIEQGLQQLKVPKIQGILITHEHSDHISGAGVMARRHAVPIYATANTWRYLLRHNVMGAVKPELQRIITPGQVLAIGDVEVMAFDTPHDSTQPVGYSLRIQGTKISVATDMGCITDTVRESIRHSNILLLESNHDLEMLKNGRYPKILKERVMSERGHLSNVMAGTLLSEIANESLRHVYLGHLSEENNRPLLALDTVERILSAHHISLANLMIADRHGPSQMVELL